MTAKTKALVVRLSAHADVGICQDIGSRGRAMLGTWPDACRGGYETGQNCRVTVVPSGVASSGSTM
jgi:hypothetical protein